MKGSGKLSEDKIKLEKMKMIQERQKRWMEERAANVSVEERRPLSGARRSTAAKQSKKSNEEKGNKNEVLLWTAKNPEMPPDNFVVRNKSKSALSSARSHKSSKSISVRPSSGKEKHKNKDQYTSTPDKNRDSQESFKTRLDKEFSALTLASLDKQNTATAIENLTANDLKYNSEKYGYGASIQEDDMLDHSNNVESATNEQKPKKNAGQFATHCCPNCKQLMNKNENAPYLIIPCGHNLCKRCLQMQISCPTCHAKISSALENTMLSQVISEHKKQEEREELARKEEQARKYVTEYDSLKTRCDVLSYKAENIIENIEEITNKLVEKKSRMKEIEENGKELRNQIQQIQEELTKYENEYGNYNKECEELELSYHKEKDNLDLLENTLERVKQSKERVKILIQNFIPSFNFQEDDNT